MTSNDLKRPQLSSKESPPQTVEPKKNKLKCGADREINHEYSDENFHNKNLQKELAMQFISNDEAVRKITVQDIKDFSSQPLATQATN